MYKVVHIAKDGFQLRLQNVETHAQKTVTHNLVNSIDLTSLEEIVFARPELYHQLVELMRYKRNTYLPGKKSTGGLHQMLPFDEPERDQPNLLVTADDPEQNGGEDGHDPEHEDAEPQTRPTFDNPGPETEEERKGEDEELPGKRIVTRYKGLRHVPVYNTKLSKTQENVISQPKCPLNMRSLSNYNRLNNFNVQLFRAENRFSFYARKKALESHQVNCNIDLCEICILFGKIKNFKFSPESLSRYNDIIENLPREKTSRKSVRFAKSTNFTEHSGNLKLNLSKLFEACEHNISFKELTLLSCNF